MTELLQTKNLSRPLLSKKFKLGAWVQDNGQCQLLVWAPQVKKVQVHIKTPKDITLPLEQLEDGYHALLTSDLLPGSNYLLDLDGKTQRPDPASRYQPLSVHNESQVVASNFPWSDSSWPGLPLDKYIIYELHTGVFSKKGDFEGIISSLPHLKELGITAIELMPVAQFPGQRNWGYDGVLPFAVQNSYGGPEGLKKLVNACHQENLAVVMDVVYNHIGPEGNYLSAFGPYFTDQYRTPWGPALNYDGAHSNHVRRYFIENALMWMEEYHIDALRLDAVHAICDFSAWTFLEELEQAVGARGKEINRKMHLIVESDLNNSRLVRPKLEGGYGYDAQWSDDFHHALHVVLTGEKTGYYQDFTGLKDLKKSLEEGYVYSGHYSSYRKRHHGNSAKDIDGHRFVIFSQNHDQVGNRLAGDRLVHSVPFEKLKLAAGLTLLSPFIPLLFMGEEYGETAPFQYFISHSDPGLIEAVRQGRREEFNAFKWSGAAPDPQDEKTFQNCKLNFDLLGKTTHAALFKFYKALIRLRKEEPALASLNKENISISINEEQKMLTMSRREGPRELYLAFNFNEKEAEAPFKVHEGHWMTVLNSADKEWNGPGSSLPKKIAPQSMVVLKREEKN